MDFLDLILTHSTSLVYVGEVATFFVPVHKLDSEKYLRDGKTPRILFEEFLMENYNAYTLEISNTQGLWREQKKSKIFRDENARYEVSFRGQENVSSFVEFLSDMCTLLKEEGIYVTMGHKSWIVLPREKPAKPPSEATS
ncbi:MAG: hypothetical protein U1D30_14275 [Planctomycetota bacterium]